MLPPVLAAFLLAGRPTARVVSAISPGGKLGQGSKDQFSLAQVVATSVNRCFPSSAVRFQLVTICHQWTSLEPGCTSPPRLPAVAGRRDRGKHHPQLATLNHPQKWVPHVSILRHGRAKNPTPTLVISAKVAAATEVESSPAVVGTCGCSCFCISLL